MPYSQTARAVPKARPVNPRWTATFRLLFVAYWAVLFLATHLPVPEMIAEEVSAFDKLIHGSAYFVLAGLLVLCHGWPYRLTPSGLLGIATFIVVYAACDEWLQTQVGRFGDVRDWTADVIGGFCALGLACLLRRAFLK